MFSAWRKDRGTDSDQESKQILEQVIGVLDQYRESRFAQFEPGHDERIIPETWGFKSAESYYIYPKAWKEQICNGYEQAKVARVLIDKGILTPGPTNNSRSTRIPSLGGVNKRVYHIRVLQEAEDEQPDSIL